MSETKSCVAVTRQNLIVYEIEDIDGDGKSDQYIEGSREVTIRARCDTDELEGDAKALWEEVASYTFRSRNMSMRVPQVVKYQNLSHFRLSSTGRELKLLDQVTIGRRTISAGLIAKGIRGRPLLDGSFLLYFVDSTYGDPVEHRVEEVKVLERRVEKSNDF